MEQSKISVRAILGWILGIIGFCICVKPLQIIIAAILGLELGAVFGGGEQTVRMVSAIGNLGGVAVAAVIGVGVYRLISRMAWW